MSMSDFFTAISNFGFPVVVAGYLLLRTESRLEKLSSTINELKSSIDYLREELSRNSSKRR